MSPSRSFLRIQSVAQHLALRADPEYTFAQLLHQACNQGLDPETLRRCLRGERSNRTGRSSHRTERSAVARAVRPPAVRRKRAQPGSVRPGTAVARRRARESRADGRGGTKSGRQP
ncbi:DUF4192 family protein [Streptomyces sp. NPDC005125]